MSRMFNVVAVFFLVCLVGLNVKGETFNARADFSTVDNPAGAWSYGYSFGLGTEMHLYPSYAPNPNYPGFSSWRDDAIGSNNDVPSVAVINGAGQWQPDFTYAPDELHFHPGQSGIASIVRWTAPTDGTSVVSALFRSAGPGQMNVFVYDRLSALFSATLSGLGSSAPYSSTFSVHAGDTVDFAVHAVDFQGCSTALAANIDFTPVPEPSSLVLLCVGSAGLIACTWTRKGSRAEQAA